MRRREGETGEKTRFQMHDGGATQKEILQEMGQKGFSSKDLVKRGRINLLQKREEMERDSEVGEQAEKGIAAQMSHLQLVEADGGNLRDSMMMTMFSAGPGLRQGGRESQAAGGTGAGSQRQVTEGFPSSWAGPVKSGTFCSKAHRSGDQNEEIWLRP